MSESVKRPNNYYVTRSKAKLENDECFSGRCMISGHWAHGFDAGYDAALVDLEENYFRGADFYPKTMFFFGIFVGIIIGSLT